ncbi:uncharacterized protein BDR25DRAFT_351996 [Lindgomyces ingoldianus]|uniref:Uncharacterized protein n=1 Tax=Lindgomyces ingoldianus TaxID=673940 RepID=A0ACB6R6N8_9PLEO|nr:uncharacterized protein BDR25DRAFT_351996 [Lindgomyces ingoldianus]KAF2474445.1 hypothetical protein BDR25DRAFT_351996 [Lindgomyces ingoldianus]
MIRAEVDRTCVIFFSVVIQRHGHHPMISRIPGVHEPAGSVSMLIPSKSCASAKRILSKRAIPGLVLGAVSLTAQTFSGCVTSLHIVSQARHSNETLLKFRTSLEIELARLILWGQNSGLSRGALHESLVPIEPLLLDILTKIFSGIENTEKLKSTYGITFAEDSELGTSHTDSTLLPTAVKDTILAVPNLLEAIDRQKRITQNLKTKMHLHRKIKWAVWDENKASNFVDCIKRYVDGLNQLLTESQKQSLDAENTAMRIAILGANWSKPLQMLQTLEMATVGRYESLALPARLARLRLEMEMEAVAPLSVQPTALPAHPLAINFDSISTIDDGRSYAKLHEKQILIEWRTLRTSEACGEEGLRRTRQAAKLAGIFKELTGQPKNYLTLDCVGYIDQKDHIPARLGIAFTVPSLPQIPHDHSSSSLTLHDYLTERDFEYFQPDLGSRFRLAYELALGFLQFHQLGWMHKNIRSHNVIFLPETPTASIQSPRIVGFGYSRPAEGGISDRPVLNEEINIYCHPDYQNDSAVSFRLQYDLFAIGLLLFEIGKWRPLSNYFRRLKARDRCVKPSNFVARLLESEAEDLEFRLGKKFTSAILFCLQTTKSELGDMDLKIEYFKNVIDTLPKWNHIRSLKHLLSLA